MTCQPPMGIPSKPGSLGRRDGAAGRPETSELGKAWGGVGGSSVQLFMPHLCRLIPRREWSDQNRARLGRCSAAILWANYGPVGPSVRRAGSFPPAAGPPHPLC
jgi:hypothetical protein